MNKYLDIDYPVTEYDENQYPQKLCDHLIEHVIEPAIGTIEYKKLLDVGCGMGNHLVGFQRRGLEVQGIDKRIAVSPAVAKVSKYDIERGSFPFYNEEFDVVFSKSVLEHIWNIDAFLGEVHRILKFGGIAILIVPDWNSQQGMFWDDYTHVKPWTKKGLKNAMIAYGFEKVECYTFKQIPLLWKYPQLNFLSIMASLLHSNRKWIRFSKEKMLLATGVK